MMRDVPNGTVVDGRYEIERRIGSGGMADVYLASDRQLGRKVAMKMLHRRFAEDTEFLERFRREASSAAGLQHPNVVGIFDRGEWDGTSYIAMEYLEGRTLKAVITEEGPLDPIRAIDIVVQVLRAARFAHKRGIIHRDLKPHNVIVDHDGRAKVTDFGIARAGASDMTQTGSIMGTAQYLSPEQAQGVPVTGQSDLYSIGIMLYEELTARVPFDGESAVTIALKQVNETAIVPSADNAAVSPELDAIVMRLLAKDPAERFPDADAAIQALDRCRGHLAAGPVQEGGATAAFRTLPPAVMALPLDPAHRLTPPEGDEEVSRANRWWIVALVVLVVLIGAFFGIRALTTKEQAIVPDGTGKPVQAALAILQNAGFQTQVERVTSSAPRDRVLRQDPQPRSRVDKGSTVTLTVSNGPGTSAVPDLVGQGRLAARRALTKAGFKIAERRSNSDTVTTDRVISTAPDAGASVERGSTVTLVISSGKQRVTVASVVGQDVDDARSTLDDLGLKISTKEVASDSQDPGTVLAQDPAGGTSVAKGSSVTLTVAKAPEDVAVPDVSGKDESAAINALGDAGLVPNEVTQPVQTAEEDGQVLSQSPKSGKKVKKGSRVTITVGRFDPSLDPEGTDTTTTTTPATTTTAPAPAVPGNR